MKTYTLPFTLAFAEKVRDDEIKDLRRAIVKFEQEFYRTLPDDFDIDELIGIICDEFAIPPEEFNSGFKYSPLGSARHILCYILSLYNVRSKDIAEMTGFSQSRVINSIRKVKDDYAQYAIHIDAITDRLGL